MTFELSNYGYDPFFDFFLPTERRTNTGLSMKTDVTEDEHNYYMDVELAGVKKENIELISFTLFVLKDDDKQIVLSSDSSPKDLNNIEERLKTRFTWGLQVDIYAPELELRKNIQAGL